MLDIHVNIDRSRSDCRVSDEDLARIAKGQCNGLIRIVKENFRRLGGRKFYAEAAAGTTAVAGGNAVTLTVSKRGVRLRWQGSAGLPGGVVKPGAGRSSVTGQPTKLLAIPATDSDLAPGHVGNPLAFQRVTGSPRLKGLLVEGEKRALKKGKRKGQVQICPKPKGEVIFWLVSETEHDPNPYVFPSIPALQSEAVNTAKQYLKLKYR